MEKKNEIVVEVVGEKEERKIVLTDEERESYIKAEKILSELDNAIVLTSERLDKIQRDLSSTLEEKRKYIKEQNDYFRTILEKYFIKAENIKSFDIKEGIIVEKIVKEETKTEAKEEVKEDNIKVETEEAKNE